MPAGDVQMRVFLLFSLSLWIGLGLNGCASQDLKFSNKGFQELSRHQYAQAERSLDKALSINPSNPYALLNMGVVYQMTGRLDKARQMYVKLIALQPKNTAQESNRGSFAGKKLVDIAEENLKLLDEREAELAAGRNAKERARQAASTEAQRVPKDERLSLKQSTNPPAEKKAPGPAAVAALSPEESRVPPKEAFCRVRKNESLVDIAGRKDVYGDTLKWPSLFRLNMDALKKMKVTDNLPEEDLPPGLRLKYVSRDRALENQAAMVDRFWVVDVASSRTMRAMVPTAILLMRKGYHVYLSNFELAGGQWIRLRVGFYKDILQALKVSEEVKAFLKTSEMPLPVMIERREFERFAGY
jgi:hypothetical protein